MSLTSIATELIQGSGYAGLGAGLIVNGIGAPLPSELLLGLAGLGVKVGRLNPWVTAAVAVSTQVIGLSIAYAIARYGGVQLVERYGKYILIRQREVQAAQRAFERYGGRLVLFGLIVPGLHGYVGYPAGLGQMRFSRFVVAASLGSAVWLVILGGLGYFLGSHLDAIDSVLHGFGALVVALLLLAAALWIRRQRRNNDATSNDAA